MDASSEGSTSETRRVVEFLAGRDVACPGCGYNLRGLLTPECPECGSTFKLAADDGSRADERMVEYLRTHDLFCRGCKTNLRGQSSGVCPVCGRTYALQRGLDIRRRGDMAGTRRGWSLWKVLLVTLFLSPVLLVVVPMLFLVLMVFLEGVTGELGGR